MKRKRVWEIGATTLLVLVVGSMLTAAWVFWERQRQLNSELEKAIGKALAMGVDKPSVARVKELIAQGADVRARDSNGMTALVVAAADGDGSITGAASVT